MKKLLSLIIIISVFSCSNESIEDLDETCSVVTKLRGLTRVGVACYAVQAHSIGNEKDLFTYKLCTNTPPEIGETLCFEDYELIDFNW